MFYSISFPIQSLKLPGGQTYPSDIASSPISIQDVVLDPERQDARKLTVEHGGILSNQDVKRTCMSEFDKTWNASILYCSRGLEVR